MSGASSSSGVSGPDESKIIIYQHGHECMLWTRAHADALRVRYRIICEGRQKQGAGSTQLVTGIPAEFLAQDTGNSNAFYNLDHTPFKNDEATPLPLCIMHEAALMLLEDGVVQVRNIDDCMSEQTLKSCIALPAQLRERVLTEWQTATDSLFTVQSREWEEDMKVREALKEDFLNKYQAEQAKKRAAEELLESLIAEAEADAGISVTAERAAEVKAEEEAQAEADAKKQAAKEAESVERKAREEAARESKRKRRAEDDALLEGFPLSFVRAARADQRTDDVHKYHLPVAYASNLLDSAVALEGEIHPALVSRNVTVDALRTQVYAGRNGELRARVYRDLWERGYFITPGLQFGGDFLAYAGDPRMNHSVFIVVVLRPDEHLGGLDFISYGRLAHGVNKYILMATVDEKQDVKPLYVSMDWDSQLSDASDKQAQARIKRGQKRPLSDILTASVLVVVGSDQKRLDAFTKAVADSAEAMGEDSMAARLKRRRRNFSHVHAKAVSNSAKRSRKGGKSDQTLTDDIKGESATSTWVTFDAASTRTTARGKDGLGSAAKRLVGRRISCAFTVCLPSSSSSSSSSSSTDADADSVQMSQDQASACVRQLRDSVKSSHTREKQLRVVYLGHARVAGIDAVLVDKFAGASRVVKNKFDEAAVLAELMSTV
jgi:tRNA splicing endonuclease